MPVLSRECTKKRKVAMKLGAVDAWVRRVGGPEVAAQLTGHSGWETMGMEAEVELDGAMVTDQEEVQELVHGGSREDGAGVDTEVGSNQTVEEEEREDGWTSGEGGKVERAGTLQGGWGGGGAAEGHTAARRHLYSQAGGQCPDGVLGGPREGTVQWIQGGTPSANHGGAAVLDWVVGHQSLKKMVKGMTKDNDPGLVCLLPPPVLGLDMNKFKSAFWVRFDRLFNEDRSDVSPGLRLLTIKLTHAGRGRLLHRSDLMLALTNQVQAPRYTYMFFAELRRACKMVG